MAYYLIIILLLSLIIFSSIAFYKFIKGNYSSYMLTFIITETTRQKLKSDNITDEKIKSLIPFLIFELLVYISLPIIFITSYKSITVRFAVVILVWLTKPIIGQIIERKLNK